MAVVAVALALAFAVDPRGDFPLNDDWAYAQSTGWLLEEGRIRLSDWVGMNLVPQILMGAAAVKAFGPGFETLRHLTQAVALASMAAAYAWFRCARFDAAGAFAATVAVVSFPAWAVLANSYMTDMYGFLLLVGAAACFARSLEEPTPRLVLAGTLLSIVGVLQRQVALVVPFAFMVASLWTARPMTARRAIVAAAPFAAAMATQVAFHAYLAGAPGVPEGQRMLVGRLVPMAWAIVTNESGLRSIGIANALSFAGYAGFFAVGWIAWGGLQGVPRRARWIVVAGGGALAAVALATGWLPPYNANNVIDPAGIGPFTLHDAWGDFAPLDRSAGFFWRAMGVAAAFGTVAMCGTLATAVVQMVRARRGADSLQVFVVSAIAGYAAPFVAIDFFDRYLLYVLPLAFVLWKVTWRDPQAGALPLRVPAAAWMLASLLLGAAATRDYFSWNRMRWDAIHEAERLGGNADTIDGGFEYNAWRRYETLPRVRTPGKSWWWVKDDRYMVAFGPVAGYRQAAWWPARRWLPRSPAGVALLERRVE